MDVKFKGNISVEQMLELVAPIERLFHDSGFSLMDDRKIEQGTSKASYVNGKGERVEYVLEASDTRRDGRSGTAFFSYKVRYFEPGSETGTIIASANISSDNDLEPRIAEEAGKAIAPALVEYMRMYSNDGMPSIVKSAWKRVAEKYLLSDPKYRPPGDGSDEAWNGNAQSDDGEVHLGVIVHERYAREAGNMKRKGVLLSLSVDGPRGLTADMQPEFYVNDLEGIELLAENMEQTLGMYEVRRAE